MNLELNPSFPLSMSFSSSVRAWVGSFLFSTAFQKDCWNLISLQHFFGAGEQHKTSLINRLYMHICTLAKRDFLIWIKLLFEIYYFALIYQSICSLKVEKEQFPVIPGYGIDSTESCKMYTFLNVISKKFWCGHRHWATCSTWKVFMYWSCWRFWGCYFYDELYMLYGCYYVDDAVLYAFHLVWETAHSNIIFYVLL